MSQANYNFTATRSARIALAMKRISSRKHIASGSLELPLLVPSPSPREKTSLRAYPALPTGTVAWVEGKPFVPTTKARGYTTADLHPRSAANNPGIWAQYAADAAGERALMLRQRDILSDFVV